MKTLAIVPFLIVVATGCATSTATAPVAAPSATVAPPEPVAILDIELKVVGKTAEVTSHSAFPADVAKTFTTAGGCENGPGGVAVKNETAFLVDLTVDGKEARILGEKDVARFLNPGATAYLCLDATKAHTVAGSAYKPMGDTLYKLSRSFTVQVTTDPTKPTSVVVSYTLIAGK